MVESRLGGGGLIFDEEYLARRRRLLEEEMGRAVRVLKDMGAHRVILVGSMAEGETDPYGDVDLVVVMPTEKRFLDRLEDVYTAVSPRVAMDILVYTPREFEELKETSPFLVQALSRGKELHDL
jgi:predicted nucleotidyltransferase